MKDMNKTKKQLVDELEDLRERVVVLETLQAEHIESQETLRKTEQRLRAIFDQTYQFIGLMDRDGNLLEANRAALDFLGLEESDVIGRPFWQSSASHSILTLNKASRL